MKPEELHKILKSLDGFEGLVGVTGGEPTLHPDFPEMCRILQTHASPLRVYGLWTSGGKRYERNKDLIEQTFDYLHYNTHSDELKGKCLHQPSTLAIKDVVKDDALRAALKSECWVPKQWGPTLNPKGVFFCEVAAALDMILDGPGGFPIEREWWNRTLEERRAQLDKYCDHCGMAIPMERQRLLDDREAFTSGNLALFREHDLPCVSDEEVTVSDRELSSEEIETAKSTWCPYNFGQVQDKTYLMLEKVQASLKARRYGAALGATWKTLRLSSMQDILYIAKTVVRRARSALLSVTSKQEV